MACQVSLSMGFSRQQYWSWLPFTRIVVHNFFFKSQDHTSYIWTWISLNGHEFEQSPRDSGGQMSLVCYRPWGWTWLTDCCCCCCYCYKQQQITKDSRSFCVCGILTTLQKKIKQLLINYLFTYLNININSNFEIILQFLKISEKMTRQASY